jgi:predicted Zn finger-like uncharacterized protein
MKLICDECGAKYSIADEKVRGKVFKIRCKKCQNVIVVRGTETPTARGGQAIPQEAQISPEGRVQETNVFQGDAPGASEPIWYVVIGREQVGPLTDQDIQARLDRGEITPESFVWQEGFSDWVQVSTVDAFSASAAAAAAAPVADPAVAEPLPSPEFEDDATRVVEQDPAFADVQLGQSQIQTVHQRDEAAAAMAAAAQPADDLFGGLPADDGEATSIVAGGAHLAGELAAGGAALDEATMTVEEGAAAAPFEPGLADPAPYDEAAALGGEVMTGGAPADNGGEHDGLFANFGADGHAPSPLQAPGADDPGMVGARNENSVLFSLQNLQSLAAGEMDGPSAPAGEGFTADAAFGAGAAPPSTVSSSEASGLIDVRSLASDTAAPGAGLADLADSDAPRAFEAPSAAPVMIPMVRRRSSLPVIVVSIIGGALILAGGGLGAVYMLKGSGGPAKASASTEAVAVPVAKPAGKAPVEVAKAEPAKPKAEPSASASKSKPDEPKAERKPSKAKRARASKASAKPAAAPVVARPEASGRTKAPKPAAAKRSSRRPAAPKASPRPASKGKGDADIDNLLAGLGEKPKAKAPRRRRPPAPRPKPTAKKPPPAPKAVAPKLSKGQVRSVLLKSGPKAQACGRKERGKTGKVMVSFQLTPTGKVAGATIKTPAFQKGAAGRCILSVVRGMRFPAFTGKSIKINFPIILK